MRKIGKVSIVITVLMLFFISCSGLRSDLKVRDLPDSTVLNVDNPLDFVMNIKSGNTLILADGTYYIEDLYDEDRMSSEGKNKSLFWETVQDGRELIVKSVQDFKLCAENPGMVNIVSKSPYAYVMNFMNAQNVIIDGIVFSHETKSDCEVGVLAFKKSSEIDISRCDIHGSGSEGLFIERTEGLNIVYSTVRECSHGFMTVKDSSEILVKNVKFFDNIFVVFRDFIIVENSSDVLFDKLIITNNGRGLNYKKDDELYEISIFEIIESDKVVLSNSIVNKNNVEFFVNEKWILKDGHGNRVNQRQFKKGMYEPKKEEEDESESGEANKDKNQP